jgi:hypothetical protein
MIRTLGIPVLNRGDLLKRCLESVDHPIETLFIINNSNGNDPSIAEVVRQMESRELDASGYFERIVVEKYPNLGCGASWNHIIRTMPGSWLITGSDVQFKPGSVVKVVQTEEANPDASLICGDGYSVFAMTKVGKEGLGFFDENYWPAYFEDVDHWRRVVLSGAKAVHADGFEFVHGEPPDWGSCTVNSDPSLKAKMSKRFGELGAYYQKKWGGPPGKEAFKSPFNRNGDLRDWKVDPDLRKAFGP